jgi:dTDP-4-amino-4,6-dideoxygalactose transaminase
MMIPFNKPPKTGAEDQFVLQAMSSNKLSGDGYFSDLCCEWFESQLSCQKVLLTPSCTHALEMAAILVGIEPGDEVIMPSFTFVSTANAFVLRGAKIVFVDVEPTTMNINAELIESAITDKTKVIVPVHYAGFACDMDKIMSIADKYHLFVIEDAAQGMMSNYKGKALGTIGHIGTFSFHETKNYTSGGEGGLLILNDEQFIERAEIIREKGTNRAQFFLGHVDKYTWVDVGSSMLPSEIQAAYLWGQLQEANAINEKRKSDWNYYQKALQPLEASGLIEIPHERDDCEHNAHMFYVKLPSLSARNQFIDQMREKGIMTVFHYLPLHSSPAGKRFGVFHGDDVFTTSESEKLVRLPMFYALTESERNNVVSAMEHVVTNLGANQG